MGLLASRRVPVARMLALLLLLPCGFGPVAAAEAVPLAIKGYDPVAYFEMHKPVRGQPQYEYEWDEQRYRFDNPRHMKMFKEDPGRYAPRFGNICTTALTYGLEWEANPEIWEIHEGRLYVFGAAGAHEDFRQDTKAVIAGAQRNQERLDKGEKPLPEKALPAGIKAEFERLYADLKRVLENQPKGR